MLIEVWWIGKTGEEYLDKGIQLYQERLRRLSPVRWTILPDIRKAASLDSDQRKSKEGDMILGKLQPDDLLILLDERGKHFSSQEWAGWLEKKMASPGKRMIFLIGGAFGFSKAVYDRANALLALSKMTMTHEMVRLVLAEQLYRAFTLMNNIKYHY